MDLSFWQWCVLAVLSVSTAVVAFKVKFDLNAWLKRREERRLNRARMLCPHVTLKKTVIDGREKVEASGPISPPMSLQFICQRCGTVILGGKEQSQELVDLYGNNPKLWVKRERRFRRAAKKLYRKGLLG